MLVSDILTGVAELLQDTGNVGWTQNQLVNWFNDAQRAVVLVRPDAYSQTIPQQLVAGTKQSLTTSGALRLLGITRNMGATGSVPGKAIQKVDMGTKDRYEPDWHTAAADSVVQEYMFDDLRPLEFYVYPAVPASPQVWIELKQSVTPPVLVYGGTVSLADNYAPALHEWVMFRSYERSSERTPDFNRANYHLGVFMQLLGVKTKSDFAVSPGTKGGVGVP